MLDSLQQENSALKQGMVEQKEHISQLERDMAALKQEKKDAEEKFKDLHEKGKLTVKKV